MKLQIAAIGMLAFHSLQAMEKTTVLPKGVRSVMIRSVNTTIDQKSTSNGTLQSIASPLEKDLTFRRVLNGEKDEVKRFTSEAFLKSHEDQFSLDDSLGTFSADMQGRISVVAPVMSYGVTENLTVAVAIPYYNAKMGVSVGFTPSAKAQEFLNALEKDDVYQLAASREVADKINDAVGELNRKLQDNGFSSLRQWNGQGVGDTTALAKMRLADQQSFKMAMTGGVVAPTGRPSSPDNLIDIPFGDGTWDLFSSVIFDEYLLPDLFLNQYAKYSYQAPARRVLRRVTEDEAIEIQKQSTRYKLGDKFETGLSLQYEPQNGLFMGVGYAYFSKFADRYAIEGNEDSKRKLEMDTAQNAQHIEARLGYSSIPAFKRKQVPVPLMASLEYKKHRASSNIAVSDLVTVDFSLFF